jgi:hypothetical protein
MVVRAETHNDLCVTHRIDLLLDIRLENGFFRHYGRMNTLEREISDITLAPLLLWARLRPLSVASGWIAQT